jgi:stage V sporulation protein K
MRRLLASNPGLRSRFAREIVFPDYSDDELVAITTKFARDYEYVLDPDAEAAVRGVFERAERGEGFGNARFARTLFEQALNAQALRLAAEGELDAVVPEMLKQLTEVDIATAARALGDEPDARPRASRWRLRRPA